MRILVTGGAGFVGSHLVDHLLAAGHEPTVLDDLSTGDERHVPPAARFVQGDVRDAGRVAPLVAGCDLVFHLAAAVGPGLVARDPVGTWTRNVEGTQRVLEACAASGRRVICTSSSEVYGADAPVPMREDQVVHLDPAARRDVYALSKLAGESLALALHRSDLLPVTVVRLFNVVGPRQSARYGMVLARFAEALAQGAPLPVYGSGEQRRCFLDVRDAVRALVALARTPASEGQIVNVGGEHEIAVKALAERVAHVAGVPPRLKHISFATMYGEGFTDPGSRRPSLERLAELVEFAPRHPLDETIADALRAAGFEPQRVRR